MPLFSFQGASSFSPEDQLVGSSGLEPPTSRLSGARSNHLSYEPVPVPGGDEQIRTVDPLLARQVLSHLSYTPVSQRSAGEYPLN